MARPLRITYPGAYYHVTSRGNERKDVFKSKRDRERFLEYLESAMQRYGAVIHERNRGQVFITDKGLMFTTEEARKLGKKSDRITG
jgi:hypothetical protein